MIWLLALVVHDFPCRDGRFGDRRACPYYWKRQLALDSLTKFLKRHGPRPGISLIDEFIGMDEEPVKRGFEELSERGWRPDSAAASKSRREQAAHQRPDQTVKTVVGRLKPATD